MSCAKKLMATEGASAEKLYVDDVFSTYLYTGNGSTQTINNGIDLAGKGGMVWTKERSSNGFNHSINDTIRGVSNQLSTGTTNSDYLRSDIKGFTQNGFTLGYDYAWGNYNGATYASWTFRKAPKFFDIVTFTTDDNGHATFSHALGASPGMIVLKATSTTSGWTTWHRGLASTRYYIQMNTTADQADLGASWITSSETAVSVSYTGALPVNATHVAYLFAHDPSEDGIIQCGSFTTDASGNATVNLGWEPQYVMIKQTNGASNWMITDTQRVLGASGVTPMYLGANTNGVEAGFNLNISATGFYQLGNYASRTYIYLAIRRPNKPPTSGTEVYKGIARTGTGAAATVTSGFDVDMVITKGRALASPRRHFWQDKLRGLTSQLASDGAEAESSFNSSTNVVGWLNSGVILGASSMVNASGETYINHFFRRAPGFFDVVCYTGTGVARTVNHNLGVAPELMIVKGSSYSNDWFVYAAPLGNSKYLRLNFTTGELSADGVSLNPMYWNATTPTSSVFSLNGDGGVNSNGYTHVAYIFATLPGISKVGSYTGNGTSQTINCGFTTGARFILVKRADAASDWYVWDSARGIVAANDPRLSLNKTAAEVTTDDSVDPYAAGFAVNQNAVTNINVSGASYIFLAIA